MMMKTRKNKKATCSSTEDVPMKHLALTNNYADEWEAVEDLTMIQQKVTLESKEGDSHHKSVMGLRTRLPPFLPTGLNFVPTGAQ